MAQRFEKKKPSRSDGFQHLFNECFFTNEMMSIFSNEDSMQKRLDPFAYDEQILELEDQLKKEFWRVVETLTTRQKEVLKLCAQGYTQMEIAKKLKVNQSSIVKSIRGNVQYSKDSKKSYGGSLRRLKLLCDKDEKIQAILNRIRSIRDESW